MQRSTPTQEKQAYKIHSAKGVCRFFSEVINVHPLIHLTSGVPSRRFTNTGYKGGLISSKEIKCNVSAGNNDKDEGSVKLEQESLPF